MTTTNCLVQKIAAKNLDALNHKKDFIHSPMPAKYDPFYVEKDWYSFWEKNNFFSPKATNKDSPVFSMVIPPPNVTGRLHIGHALMCTIEDTLVRWNRMKGKETLWVPGLDHAGIATQMVVERQLAKENLTRFDLGRTKFVERVWQWKKEFGEEINTQIRRMGASVDWSKSYFTMDQNLSSAVKNTFIALHKNKKIFRAKRFVNFSCALNTAIADCEVDKIEVPSSTFLSVPGHVRKVEFGVIHKFSYKFVENDIADEILIETTRPETMLGDVAVAVHPNDQRYTKLIGKFLQHPFLDRKMEIIADSTLVDMEKGTGVVKITPAHDEKDSECGDRHGLQGICVFDGNGRMNGNSGRFEGMLRFECRYEIIKELEKMGQYYGKRNFNQIVNICSRSGDVIEPLKISQWYVNCDDMARRSIEAVKENQLKIIPKREEKTFMHFLENIRPWCISRQLWWGHRIPAYLICLNNKKLDSDDETNWIIAESKEVATKKAKEKFGEEASVVQDTDVLDTWFSSALIPFAVFGWPEKTLDMAKFYPNSLLETGSDILFFWVARMVFMSLELNDCLPFDEILLHPIIRASDGSKMSKSKGNVINPLEIIEGATLKDILAKLLNSNLTSKQISIHTKLKEKEFKNGIPACGADALRFGLLCYLTQANSINLDINRVIGYRMFCNKIWQASNFAFSRFSLEAKKSCLNYTENNGDFSDCTPYVAFITKWIFSRLSYTELVIDSFMQRYDFASAALSLYDFFLKEFCDIYLELIKPLYHQYQNQNTTTKNTIVTKTNQSLYIILERFFRLLHPFMPFLSEELYQRMEFHIHGEKFYLAKDSVMNQTYPTFNQKWRNENTEDQMKFVLQSVHSFRSAKMLYGLGNSKLENGYVLDVSNTNTETDSLYCKAISTLAGVKTVKILRKEEKLLEKCTFDVINSSLSTHLYMEKMGKEMDANLRKSVAKMKKRMDLLEREIKSLEKRTRDQKRLSKVPEEILVRERNKLAESEKEMEKLAVGYKRIQILLSN